jgi:hypothetical protein
MHRAKRIPDRIYNMFPITHFSDIRIVLIYINIIWYYHQEIELSIYPDIPSNTA